MKLESLEDLLTIDTEKLKSPEKSRLLTRVKQLIKGENKQEAKADENAKDLPYEGISVVGNKKVEIKFDLETKEARITDVSTDTRDITTNYMAGAQAVNRLKELVKKQKELK